MFESFRNRAIVVLLKIISSITFLGSKNLYFFHTYPITSFLQTISPKRPTYDPKRKCKTKYEQVYFRLRRSETSLIWLSTATSSCSLNAIFGFPPTYSRFGWRQERINGDFGGADLNLANCTKEVLAKILGLKKYRCFEQYIVWFLVWVRFELCANGFWCSWA